MVHLYKRTTKNSLIRLNPLINENVKNAFNKFLI